MKRETLKTLLEKKNSFGKKSAQTPIPKLDLGFGTRYQNQVLVAHYIARTV